MLLSERSKRRCGVRMLEGVDELLGGDDSCIGRRRFRYRHQFREPDEGVAGSFCASLLNPNLIASVVLHCWSDVVTINSMRGPRTSCRWHLVKNNLAPEGAEGRAVEIKAMQRPSRWQSTSKDFGILDHPVEGRCFPWLVAC